MGTLAAFVFGLTLLGQIVIQPPAPSSDGSATTTAPSTDGSAIVQAPGGSSTKSSGGGTTNVFPPPDPQFVIQTEKDGTPVILQAAFQGMDSSAAKDMTNALDLALSLGSIRQDLILNPAVQEINNSMVKLVYASLGLVIAALALWGIIGTAFGSDGKEAFETLGKVPIWAAVAVTSLAWYAMVLAAFGALGTAIASSAHGAFGPTLRPDFWSNNGVDLFASFSGLIMFIMLLFFAIRLFANTAFLAFCAIVAPVFVFLKATPWTSKWGNNWFRMVPASAGDILAMLLMLVIGAAILDHVELGNAMASVLFNIGLILAIPLVEELFGLKHSSAGGRIWDLLFLSRLRRITRGATAAATPTPARNPTAPSRAPRWT